MRYLQARIGIAFFCLATAVSLPAAAEGLHKHLHRVPQEYLVVLKDTPGLDIPATANALGKRYHGDVRKVWQHAIHGFFIVMPEERALALSRDPRVDYVEENAETFSSASRPTNRDPACVGTNAQCATTDNRLWHLDRIDQETVKPLDNLYHSCTSGKNVYVYVVDTGVMGNHSEFSAGQVQEGFDASGDSGKPANDPCNGWPVPVPAPTYSTDDRFDYNNYQQELTYSGHGTSVASLVAGQNVGVAKDAIIIPVKAVRCDLFAARRWKANTYYKVGDWVMKSYWEKCTKAGWSGTSEPDWPSTAGAEISDGSEPNNVKWKNMSPVGGEISPASTQMMIDGVNWILTQNKYPRSPAIATFSRFALASDEQAGALDNSIRNLIAAGITVIASANNQDADACTTIPAHLSRGNNDPAIASPNNKVITVGGSMVLNNPDNYGRGDGGPLVMQLEPTYQGNEPTTDVRWICGAGDSDYCGGDTKGSNYGKCVDAFAPAKNITSALFLRSDTYRNRLGKSDDPLPPQASGTSFSAPIAAGIAALFLEMDPTASVDDVYQALMNSAVKGKMVDSDSTLHGSPNRLLQATDVFLVTQPKSQYVPPNGSVTLSVNAYGPQGATLTYQWYRGHRAAPEGSVLIATSPTLQVSASEPTSYWVRVKSSCADGSGVASDDATITPQISGPTGFAATAGASANTVVSLSWSPVPGAQKYRIERSPTYATGSASNPFVAINEVAATSTSDWPPASAAPSTYVYRVIALDAAGGPMSMPSAIDYATVATNLFTDKPLQTATTPVRAAHLSELRAEVNAVRAAATIGSYTWQQPVGPVTAASLNELRSALDAARSAMGLVNYPYSESVSPGSILKKLHIEEVRTAIR